MKNIIISILSIMTLFSCNSNAQQSDSEKQTNSVKERKSLIVFYSRSGNNYVSGDIVNLKVGNTKVIAQKIQKLTDADIFEIVPEIDYSDDYTECVQVARQEKQKQCTSKIHERRN